MKTLKWSSLVAVLAGCAQDKWALQNAPNASARSSTATS
jgi:hypothetical protein